MSQLTRKRQNPDRAIVTLIYVLIKFFANWSGSIFTLGSPVPFASLKMPNPCPISTKIGPDFEAQINPALSIVTESHFLPPAAKGHDDENSGRR